LFQDVTDKIDADLTEAQTFRFTYDGKTYEYTINQDTTVGQLISSINQSEAAKNGITAYLDDSGKLAFILPEASNIEFDDGTPDGSGVLAKLGLQVSYQSGDYTDKTYQEVKANGTDAKVKFNVAGDGEPIEASYSSNTFTINGMTFTLKSTSTAPEEIAVAHDVQAVFDSIKGFVDKYNEIIDKINSKLSEERYRSYAPLTDEQRKEMSEKEIELWEAKAKSGMIRRDQTLESALIQFRNAFSSMVSGLPSGSVSQLHQIGITTGEWSERGKLHIDEAKLKQALTEDPEQVMRLFTADDGDDKSTNGDGIANRIYQVADTFYKRIVEKAGSAATTVLDNYAIGKNIKDIDERIENMNRRLISLEERYYRQFTAMETALSKMNAQAAYLLQQFGGA
jgi:flagellar hook-associated protein 2